MKHLNWIVAVAFLASVSTLNRCATAQAKTADGDSASGLGAMIKAVKPTAAVIAPPAPIIAVKGDVQLDGLYLQLQTMAIGGRITLQSYYYYFLPDGHLYYGVPPGGLLKPNASNDDFVALQNIEPKNCGTYLVKGDKITFQYANGKPAIHGFALEKSGNKDVVTLDGVSAVKMGRFKDYQTLDAMYEGGASARYSSVGSTTPDSFISSSSTLDFHPDGTFGKAAASSFDIAGRTSNTSGGGTSSGGGKYKISGNTLTLIHGDGKTEILTIYPMGDGKESPPGHIGVNGSIYQLQKRG